MGAPSVLFDAVALLPSADGAAELAARKSAEDFVADAFGHHKFIGWNAAAAPLFEAAGVEEDAGVIELKGTAASAKAFLQGLRGTADVGAGRPAVTRFGYFLSCEEYAPDQLLEQARLAEKAGFDALWISDHFHPWTNAQGAVTHTSGR